MALIFPRSLEPLATCPASRRLAVVGTYVLYLRRLAHTPLPGNGRASAEQRAEMAALLATLLPEQAALREAHAQRRAEHVAHQGVRAKVRPPKINVARPETPDEARERAWRAQQTVARLADGAGLDGAAPAGAWELRRRCDPAPYHESPPRDLPDGFYGDVLAADDEHDDEAPR